MSEKKGIFKRLKEGLNKTRNALSEKIDTVFSSFKKIDDSLYDELEEALIIADLGAETSMDIVDELRKRVKEQKISDAKDAKELLKNIISEILQSDDSSLDLSGTPAVILVIGVNGVGKTTTIGKLTAKLKKQGKSIILAAADTFRAAAIDQLEVWADRNDVPIIKHEEGSDPGAVVYDAVFAAKSKNTDILIIDTAGRLHNKKNLMEELKKIFRIIDRELPNASKEILLVLDATTGQNAVNQAEVFKEAAEVTGIVLTKLDGTAKGGIIISIKSKLSIPVKFVGVGEGIDDLQEFDPQEFAKALFDNTDTDEEIQEVDEEIEKVHEEIQEEDEEIEKVDEKIQEVDEEIEKVDEKTQEVNEEIEETQEVNEEIEETQEKIKEIDEEIQKVDEKIEKIDEKTEKDEEKSKEQKENSRFKKVLDKFKFFR